MSKQLIQQFADRIRELESRIDNLYTIRRQLLNTIENLEHDSQNKQMELEIRNNRLQKDNCRYARAVMLRNVRILELEEQLQLQVGRSAR